LESELVGAISLRCSHVEKQPARRKGARRLWGYIFLANDFLLNKDDGARIKDKR